MVLSFAISFVAGWVYLSWDIEPRDEETNVMENVTEEPVTPPLSPRDLLLEDLRTLTDAMRDADASTYDILVNTFESKLKQLLSDKDITVANMGTLALPEDIRIRTLPAVPYLGGELSLFNCALYHEPGYQKCFLRVQRKDQITITETYGEIESLRAVEFDGITYAVAISSQTQGTAEVPDFNNYLVKIFGFDQGQFALLDQLDTHIQKIDYTHHLSVEIDRGRLTLYDALQPQLGKIRLMKREGFFRFERPPADADVPLPDDFSRYGLLLGLSDDTGGNRTLWIRPVADRLCINEISDAIVFPYQGGFHWLKNVQRDIESSLPINEGQTNVLALSKLLFGALGEDLFGRLAPFSATQNVWEGGAISTDVLYHVSDQYICYVNQYYSGGGSYAWYIEHARTIPLEAINRFIPIEQDSITDRSYVAFDQPEQIDLSALLSSELLRDSQALSDFDNNVDARESLDFHNLMLIHSQGRWRVSVPILRKNYNPGNSGGSSSFERFLPLSVTLPESITGFETWPTDTTVDDSLFWNDFVSDAVAAPDFNAFVAISDDGVSVTDENSRYYAPILSVPSRPNERVVSVRWANPQTVSQWESDLMPYFNRD